MQHSKWIALGFSAVCLIAVAAVLRADHLYYMAAILLCLPGVSYVMGWYALRGLEFTRVLPATAWEGQEGVIQYVVRNRSRIARYFLTIHERLPEWIVSEDADASLFNVDALGETLVRQPVTYRKRGVHDVDSFIVTATDPLGVFAFSKRIPCSGEIVVYPQATRFEAIPLSGSDRFGWQEFVSMMLHGTSVDPDGVRPYVAGDPLRHIHWRQTARTGALSVIEFEEAQAINLVIVLDARRDTDVGSGTNTTLEYGVRMAAAVAEEAIRQGAMVQLIVPHDATATRSEVETTVSIGRSRTQLYTILDTLARVEARSATSISELIASEVRYTPPGTGVVVITSDADPDLTETLMRYTATGANVDVVYIDPSTFTRAGARANPSRAEQVIAGLFGVAAHVYRVRSDPEGRLHPEEITHGRQRI